MNGKEKTFPAGRTALRLSALEFLDRLARIYEVFPLVCPTCQEPLTFIAFLTEPEPICQILAHIGEPTSPPLLHPARGPPQAELAMVPMGTDRGQADEAAQESFPDDLDQSSEFDPVEPERHTRSAFSGVGLTQRSRSPVARGRPWTARA